MKTSNILDFPDSTLTDQDIVNLFMGLVRLVKRQYQSQIDALKIQLEEIKSSQQLATNE